MTIQPRKQRKIMYTLPLHKKRKSVAAHMADELILKYKRRNFSVVKGDTVKVMRGEFHGHTGKVREVFVSSSSIDVEGVTTTKVDGKKVPREVHSSNVLITKLNLADPWRRKRLEEGLPEDVKKEIEKEAKEQIIEQERIIAEEEALKKKAEEESIKEEHPDSEEIKEDSVEEISFEDLEETETENNEQTENSVAETELQDDDASSNISDTNAVIDKDDSTENLDVNIEDDQPKTDVDESDKNHKKEEVEQNEAS